MLSRLLLLRNVRVRQFFLWFRIVTHPIAKLWVCFSYLTRDVATLRCKDTEGISIGNANVAILHLLVELGRIERMRQGRHYSPTHSVSFSCSQRTLLSWYPESLMPV